MTSIPAPSFHDPSFLGQYPMTSSPRLQLAASTPSFRFPHLEPIYTQQHMPLFFDRHPPSSATRRPSPQMSERQAEQCDEAEENEEKLSGKWSTAQTGAHANACKDCFADLESRKNPAAWRTILQNVNETGGKKSIDQAKKKLRNLKDRYKEAKENSKKSGGARNFPKYYAVFHEVLGTRRQVRLNKVRESEQTNQFHNPRRMVSKQTEGPVVPSDLHAEDHEQGIEEEDRQPKRTKKKRASTSAASTQLQ